MSKNITIKISKEFTFEDISDLLCSALEGGSNYWYIIDKYNKPKNLKNTKEKHFRHLSYPLNEGGSLIISDRDYSKDCKNKKLDLNSIKKGLQLMADKFPEEFASFSSGNYDAGTADTFLQLCLFKEIVFC